MLTLAVPLTSHLNDVYAGVDHVALTSLMAKKGNIPTREAYEDCESNMEQESTEPLQRAWTRPERPSSTSSKKSWPCTSPFTVPLLKLGP